MGLQEGGIPRPFIAPVRGCMIEHSQGPTVYFALAIVMDCQFTGCTGYSSGLSVHSLCWLLSWTVSCTGYFPGLLSGATLRGHQPPNLLSLLIKLQTKVPAVSCHPSHLSFFYPLSAHCTSHQIPCSVLSPFSPPLLSSLCITFHSKVAAVSYRPPLQSFCSDLLPVTT
jgi:hypothetical protein